MTRRFTKWFIAVAATALLATGALAQGVIPIQGQGTASAINAYQFAGSGQVRVGHRWVNETSLATLLALGPGPGNTLVGQSTHTLNLGVLGSVTTQDELTLVPINDQGLYIMCIRCDIVGGTGEFAHASGKLFFGGLANLATGQIAWRLHGFSRN